MDMNRHRFAGRRQDGCKGSAVECYDKVHLRKRINTDDKDGNDFLSQMRNISVETDSVIANFRCANG
jgi:hypothetical protein